MLILQSRSLQEVTQQGPVLGAVPAIDLFCLLHHVSPTLCGNRRQYHRPPKHTDGSQGSSGIAMKGGFEVRTSETVCYSTRVVAFWG